MNPLKEKQRKKLIENGDKDLADKVDEVASYLSGLEKRIKELEGLLKAGAERIATATEAYIKEKNIPTPSIYKGEQYMKDDENIIIPKELIKDEEGCDCGCHTSESSSEDMKKNGCDLCYSESKYYPRHKSKEPIKDWEKYIDENYVEYDGKWYMKGLPGGICKKFTMQDLKELISQEREKVKAEIRVWADNKLKDNEISNGYYNAINDLINYLK